MRTTVSCLIGVDISTKKIATAYVHGQLDGAWGPVLLHEVVAKGDHADDRFDGLLAGFMRHILLFTPAGIDHVYIEDVSFVKGARRTELDLAKVLGGVRALLVEAGVSYTIVNNARWKAGIGLGGRAKKPAIMAHAIDFWGVTPESQDLADALGILEWGMMCFGREVFFKDKGCL